MTTNLWRGQVTTWDADRDKGILHLVLHAEDHNRLYDLGDVGAPTGPPGGANIVAADGTITWVDAAAQSFGDGSGLQDGSVYRYLVSTYWPGGNDGTFGDVHQVGDGVTGFNTLDWQTSLTRLRAVIEEVMATFAGPYAAFWRDADKVHHWTRLAPVGEVSEFAIEAPFRLSSSPADFHFTGSPKTIPARITVGKSVRDLRKRVHVNGGLPTANRFVTSATAPGRAGDDYISAEGAQTADQATAIGEFHLANTFTGKYRGTAVPVPHKDNTAFHGWRVGQTGYFSDPELSRVFAMDELPAIIQSVDAERVGGPVGISIDGDALTILEIGKVATHDILGSVGTADVDIWIADPEETFSVADLAELLITVDNNSEVQYTLGWGDVPVGSARRQNTRAAVPPPAAAKGDRAGIPYKVNWTHGDPGIKDGESTYVQFQLADQTGAPAKKANVSHTWTILQDGDSYAIDPGEGTNMLTDSNGQSAVNLARDDSGTPSTYHQFLIVGDEVLG